MNTYTGIFRSTAMVALGMVLSASASAESTVLGGVFDGSEPTMASFRNCGSEPAPYQQIPFEVSQDGKYQQGGIETHDSILRVYEGAFDPEQPEQNVVPGISMGWFGGYEFSAGNDYVLVVQHDCGLIEKSWSAAFIGPGLVISEATVELPPFSQGILSDDDPTMPTHCGSLWGAWGWGVVDGASFQQSGPIRVARNGTYYYSSVVIQNGASVCLSIYSAPVDSLNPTANQVAMLGGFYESTELEAGKDYYFVTQWSGGEIDDDVSNSKGEFLHVLTPPAPFRINSAIAGGWHNPETPGQGFFLTAYEKLNQAFLGWFTYATEPSAEDEFGHRWMTAFGNFEGASADLDIELTGGGGFDAANPVPEQNVVGMIRLNFTDCTSGEVIYGWDFDQSGSPAVSGIIPIRRLANDSVALCESLYAGPGMPGPL